MPYLEVTDAGGVALYDERSFVAPEILEGSKLKDGSKPVEKQGDEDTADMRIGAEPVAILTGDELGPWEDIRQLGKKAEASYRNNLIGQTVINATSRMKITFTNAGAKKIAGRKGDVLYRAVPALRQIIESGKVTGTTQETKGRSQIKAWHTISATVSIDGKPRDLVAHAMETHDRNFHYDLSRDMGDGAKFMRLTAGTSITASRYGLEDNPIDLNIDFATMFGKEARPSSLGTFGPDGIQIKAGYGVSPLGVLRHEIIHALRSTPLWGKPYGVFTGAERQSLASVICLGDVSRKHHLQMIQFSVVRAVAAGPRFLTSYD